MAAFTIVWENQCCKLPLVSPTPRPLRVLVHLSVNQNIHSFIVLNSWFVWGPVHTNPFSNENGTVLLQIRLSSTPQRRKQSPKTEPFENALQSGTIWKRCFLKTLFSSRDGENDAIWKRRRHQNRHDRAPDHSTVSIQNGGQTLPCNFNFAGRFIEMRVRPASRASSSFEHAHWEYKNVFKRIRRCSVDGRKRYENDKCGRKSFSFENGLV